MGKVVLVYRVMPEGPDVDVAAIQKAIPASLPAKTEMQGSQIQPFAFGLNALMVKIVGPDQEGIPDSVEAALGKLPGVQSVEIVEQSLM